ncbi:MAG: PilZ domain-containing protein [Candidatus Woesearchaeota archaeon]
MSIDQTVVVPDRRGYERCKPEEASVVYSTGLLSYIPFLRRYCQRGASVVDLSGGGVCINVAERIKPKTKVRLSITIPRYNEVIPLEGVVRRCFENPKEGRIYAGIEFCEMPAPLRAKLRAMCEYFNSSYYKDRLRERAEKEMFFR